MTVPEPPAHLQPYIDILGTDLAMEFLLTFGGAELYLARSPSEQGKVAQLVGVKLAAELAAAAEGLRIQKRVPTGKNWIARVLSGKGLPVAEIARRLHTTDVTVRTYLRQKPSRKLGKRDDGQLPLF